MDFRIRATPSKEIPKETIFVKRPLFRLRATLGPTNPPTMAPTDNQGVKAMSTCPRQMRVTDPVSDTTSSTSLAAATATSVGKPATVMPVVGTTAADGRKLLH